MKQYEFKYMTWSRSAEINFFKLLFEIMHQISKKFISVNVLNGATNNAIFWMQYHKKKKKRLLKIIASTKPSGC